MVRPPIPCPVSLVTNCDHRAGGVVEYKQDPVEKSRYHVQVEEGLFASSDEPCPDSTQLDPFAIDESAVQYWSDYNLVDYHPRSIQKIPDLLDWDRGMGDWVAGKETFRRYNKQVNISFQAAWSRLIECFRTVSP